MQRSITSKPDQASSRRGFTIVELLIVIVVIAILAAITIVAYTGISQRAIAASLQSDLDNASKQLKLFQVDNSAYPTTNDCSASPAAGSICLKSASGTTYTAFQIGNTSNPQTFCLTAMNNGINYRTTNDGTPTAGTCSGVMSGGTSCPAGFIVVPGSSTYGTYDFCVMKYAASQSSATVPISQSGSTPWVSISQTNAISYSANVAGCTGCHLITEPEFMTIAQNVLSVPSNWSSGTVGTGFIYSGHNDNAPANALAADSNDANGYAGTGNSSPSNQRRTLTLTNGEVIWDLAGNVWEWTSGTSTTGQPGITGEAGYAWKEWTSVTTNGTNPTNPSPVGTNLTGASTWNSGKGVGQLYSYAGESAVRGFFRGGSWYRGGYAGVLALILSYAPGDTSAYVGFRVSR
jgi:prepilin-type N-terminal cleavage/methylation domain-containing protein